LELKHFAQHAKRGDAIDSRRAKTIRFRLRRSGPRSRILSRDILKTNQEDQTMMTSTKVRTHCSWLLALGAVLVAVLGAPLAVDAQVIQGVQQGAQAGNRAAGPVGGVLGGAIGGVVGVFTGVLGVGRNEQAAPPASGATAPKQVGPAKTVKGAKGAKTTKQAVLTQGGEPQLTAEQIVANSDANIERIKAELNLTPEQEKNWTAFNSAMHYLGHNGADRLNLRIARAKRDPPDDIIEQMRNEAQFLNDRAVDQRNVADAAEPLFASLNDKQKAMFIEEMVRLSHERGLD
jgi:LTXXQ motif family protein